MPEYTASERPSVDPAALLVGVLAVALVPLIEPGPWGWLNTAIGGAVALVVFAFYVASQRWDDLRLLERISVLGVLWVVTLVALAWPLQDAFTDACPRADSGEFDTRCEDRRGEDGTAMAGGLALVLVSAIGVAREAWSPRRRSR